ncbi:HupE/UreJ family protein [Bordetella bronchiseptica]|nr:HupE/UreJ family protein [Bordetella bronchiseptica]KDS77003.1 urease accessory protein [Bordetella bronchiseptica KM22]WLS59725.1 HupE/UreJ family protein [Bordetella bronchiseptica]WLS64558.1 HupE/UreJ family protein [Bordetella bronchiseptica]VTQ73067.1 HupE / UreJ protein [Bordetella bronchiseptica]
MKAMSKRAMLGSGAAALMLFSGAALAHPGHLGHELPGSMFAAGFWHPLTGFDHLLAMLAVGMWSALTHHTARQAVWLPVMFLALLFAGAMMGMAGVRLPAVEPVIMVSLLVLGLLVASRKAVQGWAGFALVGGFALFHGLAHGMELPGSEGALGFVAGFMLATLGLHLAGLFAGFRLKHWNLWLSRALGMGIAGYGALLFVGARV